MMPRIEATTIVTRPDFSARDLTRFGSGFCVDVTGGETEFCIAGLSEAAARIVAAVLNEDAIPANFLEEYSAAIGAPTAGDYRRSLGYPG